MNFNELITSNEIPRTTHKLVGSSINLSDLAKPKLTDKELRLAKDIEPGHKIGTGSFHQVAQWCDTCNDVKSFAHKVEKKRMICLCCKKVKTY